MYFCKPVSHIPPSSSHDSSFSDLTSCSTPPPPPNHLCVLSLASHHPDLPRFICLTLVHGDSHSGKTRAERKKLQFWTRSAPTPLTSVSPSYHHPAPSRQLSWKWTLPSWTKRALRLAFELMVHTQIQTPLLQWGFEKNGFFCRWLDGFSTEYIWQMILTFTPLLDFAKNLKCVRHPEVPLCGWWGVKIQELAWQSSEIK